MISVPIRKCFTVIISIFTVFTLVFQMNEVAYADDSSLAVETAKASGDKWNLPYISAHSVILMDAETGDILYDREGQTQRPPASTTKILTAIVALEMADIEEISTVSEKTDCVGESSLNLNQGNQIKLGELIEGALVKSGNDACAAIAEQTAGSVDEFARLMNQKAVSLGAYRSNFTNPHGLPDQNHYSTAYDLAVIARYAMKNPVFSKIVSQKVSTITYEKPQKSQIVKNTNKLLWNYPYADGIKTGTTNAAGKCLIASASNNGRRLIAVILNGPDRFGDAQRLFEWGFNHTEMITIGKAGDVVGVYPGYGGKISVVLPKEITLCLEKDKVKDLKFQVELKKDVYPPIKKGDVLGEYRIMREEILIKTVSLVSQQDFVEIPIHFSGTINLVVDRFLDLLDKKG